MSWAHVKSTGSGFLNYRLVIAGWPHEWTTSIKVTHASGADGRKVYPSLKFDGLKITEKVSIRDAWTDVQGMTFTIIPTTPGEETVNGFTRDPVVMGYLAASPTLTAGDIAATGSSALVVLDTSFILAAGTYHIGTEALTGFGTNSLNRARWDTVNEKHTAVLGVAVYNWPPTMEGRRAYLYAYGEGDDPTGNGTQIWVGVVSSPQKMSGDGITWTINCESVTSVFKQRLASAENREYRIRGIYHSDNCPLAIAYRAHYSDDSHQATAFDTIWISGFDETQEDWITRVNARLGGLIALRASAPPHNGSAELVSAIYEERGGTPTITLNHRPSADLTINFRSVWLPAQGVLDGAMIERASTQSVMITLAPWATPEARRMALGADYFYDFVNVFNSMVIDYFGDGSGAYTLENVPSDFLPPYTYPLPAARAMLGGVPPGASSWNNAGLPYKSDPRLAGTSSIVNPPDRLYLNTVDGLSVGDVLYVSNGDKSTPIQISAIDVPGRWVTAAIKNGDYAVYFDDKSTLIPLRTMALNTDLGGFLTAVVAASPNANDGDTPFVINGDVNTATLAAAFAGSGIDSYWYHRNYTYFKPTAIKDVLTPELKMIGWMSRLEADGRVGFTKMPRLSATRAANRTLTDASILPPANGMAGSWIEWASQPDGLVNAATVKLGYDPVQDDFNENLTFNVRVISSVADHKSSGKGAVDIEVKSTQSGSASVSASVNATTFVLRPGLSLGGVANNTKVTEWLEVYLSILSTEYAVVTLSVPFTFFDQLVGNVLDVTCKQIPHGQGGANPRGVVSRKASIIGREWNLDPKLGQMGKLTLYFPRIIGAGYTPTGRVTGQVAIGGNSWTLAFSPSNAFNLRWSETGNGDIAKHFAVGDWIQVIPTGQINPTVVAGQVTQVYGPVLDITATLIDVTFTTTWTPGSSVWNLMFLQNANLLTTRQNTYCIVADANRALVDNTYARKYV
jgi:hypothetical protein